MLDNFLTDEEETRSNKVVILQKNAENTEYIRNEKVLSKMRKKKHFSLGSERDR